MNNEPNISLYGDAASEDFPVLKAFQQYIDAEQAKARRRLLTVSIIFAVVLVVVIAIFSVLVISANSQTQRLNDRLVEFFMDQSGRNNANAPKADSDTDTAKAVNALNEALDRIQHRIDEQSRQAAPVPANPAPVVVKEPPAPTPSQDPSVEKRVQDVEARIQKQLARLKAEKEKLDDEKKQRREEELERYRREHYPEYYAKLEAAEKAKREAEESAKTPSAPSVGKKTDIDAEISKVVTYEELEEEVPEVEFDPLPEMKKTKAPVNPLEDVDLSDDEAIEYFSRDDKEETVTIPVEVEGKKASWRIPMN